MIRSKEELNEYLKADNAWLLPNNWKEKMIADYACYPHRTIKQYLYYLRKQEYYINMADGSRIRGLISLFYERKKNRLGNQLGIEIGPNCFGKGLNLYHIGSIIINPAVRAGDNCSLHGNNCIGNNGKSKAVPKLGNNIDIGYGAVLIGDIEIADDIKIGANSFVNKSFMESGCTIAGVPARIVKYADKKR